MIMCYPILDILSGTFVEVTESEEAEETGGEE